MVVATVLAVIVLWPLRGVLEAAPLVLFAASLVLFLAPGLLVTRWVFAPGQLSAPALLPVAFVISTGLFAGAGVPVLMLGLSMNSYLLVAGGVLAAFLLVGTLAAFYGVGPVKETTASYGPPAGILWVPFVLLAGVLAFLSRMKVPHFYDDMWVYISYVRDFVTSANLAQYEPYFGNEAGLTRLKINGWLLEQAALARISGVDAIEMVLWYLNPTLTVVCLLAFYALARVLFESERAAVMAGCVFAAFLLANVGGTVHLVGGEFVARLAEDKYAARFLFLPVALMVAVLFLRYRRSSYLLLFAFLCWSVVGVHPIGLALIGLSMAGFGLVYLAANRRDRGSWWSIFKLGMAGLSVGLLPLMLVPVTGVPLTDLLKAADINSGDPRVLANMVFVRPERQRIVEFADGSYIMHPAFVLDPVILAAFVLGVPFLLWRVRRDMVAQLLLGTLVFTAGLVYIPPITTFVGDNLILPGQIHRLTWAISLAAVLTVGWMAWEAIRYAQARLGGSRIARQIAGALPLVVVAVSLGVAAPTAVTGAEEVVLGNRTEPEGIGHGFDPVFPWMRDNIEEESVVFARDHLNTLIPAWSANANVVSLRAGLVYEVLPDLQRRTGGAIVVPQGARDMQEFYSGVSLERAIELLRRQNADYLLVYPDTPFEEYFQQSPEFTLMDTPSEVYSLYRVDLEGDGP